MSDKPQLHQSELTQLEGCGIQFQRRYGYKYDRHDKKEVIPPGVALLIGIGTHKAGEHNLQNKIDTGELLEVEEVKSIARDSMTGQWQGEVRLFEEEQANINATKGASIDMAVKLSELHAVNIAPTIEPVAIEVPWAITLEGYPYDLAGITDVKEKKGLRDCKTSGKSITQADADNSEQLSMYALERKVCDKLELPIPVFLDGLIKLKTPKSMTIESVRTERHVQALLRRIERAFEIIDKGAFMPARQDDWR